MTPVARRSFIRWLPSMCEALGQAGGLGREHHRTGDSSVDYDPGPRPQPRRKTCHGYQCKPTCGGGSQEEHSLVASTHRVWKRKAVLLALKPENH